MRVLLYSALTAWWLLTIATTASAQHPDSTTFDREIAVERVEVVGRRPMKEIGVQQTRFDSMILKEHIALSMADVLTFNSSVFVKSYGRATLSTVAFRGTSPSHTQVLWNGMRINSPMLGMTDFSMIPSHFIDDAALLHGTSSVSETGGGLGGAVKLSTRPLQQEGFGLNYVQGVGSFRTFDEYLRLSYGNERWQLSTRLVYASSPNDYRYTNRDKMENIYDENHNIIDQYHPTERNRNGAYKDFHALQEIAYRTRGGARLSLTAWYTASDRELPMTTTSYADDERIENRQREETLRALLGWERLNRDGKWQAKVGYVHTWSAYDRKIQLYASENDTPSEGYSDGTLEDTRNRIHSLFGQLSTEQIWGEDWLLSGELTTYYHRVRSRGKEVIGDEGTTRLGYEADCIEATASATLRRRLGERVGVGLTLREELYDQEFSPLIPALFVDGELVRGGRLVAKASASRNYRFPTLNDRYFQPGGNPDLRPERGWTYDLGLSFTAIESRRLQLTGSLSWFDSHIDDWIMWFPKAMGYYTPLNVKQVHSYGIENELTAEYRPTEQWIIKLHAAYAWTPSLNEGEPFSSADRSVGKQLPYVPKHSASATLHVAWRGWEMGYKWCRYSERYTLSSNGSSITGTLDAYAVSNLSLERRIALRWADLSVKGAINNLFDKEYQTLLARPMPGIHYEFFIGITPRWGKKSSR